MVKAVLITTARMQEKVWKRLASETLYKATFIEIDLIYLWKEEKQRSR